MTLPVSVPGLVGGSAGAVGAGVGGFVGAGVTAFLDDVAVGVAGRVVFAGEGDVGTTEDGAGDDGAGEEGGADVGVSEIDAVVVGGWL